MVIFTQKISYLIFIQFTILVLLFSFILKSNDDKTNKDVHHKESDNDDKDKVENGDKRLVVINGSVVLLVGINRFIQQPVQILASMYYTTYRSK